MKLYTFRTRPEMQAAMEAAIEAALAAMRADATLKPTEARTPERQAIVDRFSLLMRLVETTPLDYLPTLLALVEGFVVEKMEAPEEEEGAGPLRRAATDGRVH